MADVELWEWSMGRRPGGRKMFRSGLLILVSCLIASTAIATATEDSKVPVRVFLSGEKLLLFLDTAEAASRGEEPAPVAMDGENISGARAVTYALGFCTAVTEIFCWEHGADVIPAGVTGPQLQRTIHAFLKTNPDLLRLPASVLVRKALSTAFLGESATPSSGPKWK